MAGEKCATFASGFQHILDFTSSFYNIQDIKKF